MNDVTHPDPEPACVRASHDSVLVYLGTATWLFHRQVLREEAYAFSGTSPGKSGPSGAVLLVTMALFIL